MKKVFRCLNHPQQDPYDCLGGSGARDDNYIRGKMLTFRHPDPELAPAERAYFIY